MTESLQVNDDLWKVTPPDISHIITEDEAPVDNIFSERQMGLLTDALYISWQEPGAEGTFVALANVGLFYAIHQDPYVPDVLVSLGVTLPTDVWQKEHRSYFIWEYGKPPDIVVEIVSNRVGGELSRKRSGYARLGITYYLVFDPEQQLTKQRLYVFELRGGAYVELEQPWLPAVGLGVALWQGPYMGLEAEWLRWCDIDGTLLPTGDEAAASARREATEAQARAEQERERAEQERERAERLAAKLRALGIDPTSVS
ncbi:MAG: Uma2 family endonuclease [Caldilineaceae bacterium]|nr:Uma2 family endonuclease [Caldilineaceae bacterium]